MASETLSPKIKRRSGVFSLSADSSIITMMVKDAMNDIDPVIIGIIVTHSIICREEGMFEKLCRGFLLLLLGLTY